jgi:hypothetical protein
MILLEAERGANEKDERRGQDLTSCCICIISEWGGMASSRVSLFCRCGVVCKSYLVERTNHLLEVVIVAQAPN